SECGHGLETVHAVILINGIMDCKYHVLLSIEPPLIFGASGERPMTATTQTHSHYAFTPTVKAIQARKGSRASYQQREERPWNTTVTPDLAAFIAAQTSFFMATATADGQPYIQ